MSLPELVAPDILIVSNFRFLPIPAGLCRPAQQIFCLHLPNLTCPIAVTTECQANFSAKSQLDKITLKAREKHLMANRERQIWVKN